MGRLLCVLVAATLALTGDHAAAALPSEIIAGPLVARERCAEDQAGRERARHAVREARERHGVALARMLRGHSAPRPAAAILQADAMLARIGAEADGVLVARGACAADEVVRSALSAMETVAGLTSPAVAAAEATPRATARPVYRPTPRPTPHAWTAWRWRPTPRPTPTARPLPTRPLFEFRQGPGPVLPQKSR